MLPFENTDQDPDIDYIADGLTDGLIDHLTRAKSLKVMARATVMRFKGQPPPEAARALKVGAVSRARCRGAATRSSCPPS